jgi:hypothetical protein
MKRFYRLIFFPVILFFLVGCAQNIGFGVGTAIGGSNGGTEILVTQDGIHGSVVAGDDSIH